MINVKISYTCLVVSHHWCHHRIYSPTGCVTHLCEPAQRQGVLHDRLAAKQLQFPSDPLGASFASGSALLAYWGMTFINSGGAGGPLAITGDGMLLSIYQPNSVMRIAGATCLSAAFLSIV